MYNIYMKFAHIVDCENIKLLITNIPDAIFPFPNPLSLQDE